MEALVWQVHIRLLLKQVNYNLVLPSRCGVVEGRPALEIHGVDEALGRSIKEQVGHVSVQGSLVYAAAVSWVLPAAGFQLGIVPVPGTWISHLAPLSQHVYQLRRCLPLGGARGHVVMEETSTWRALQRPSMPCFLHRRFF